MTALLIILLVLAGLLSLKVGVVFKKSPGITYLAVKIGPRKLTLLPREERKAKKKKKPKKAKEPEPDETAEAVEEEKPAFKLEKGELKEIIRMVLEALGSFRRALYVDRFDMHYTMAGRDPYSTAINYGRLNAVVAGALPVVEQVIKVKKRDIIFDVDFVEKKSIMDMYAVITVRIGGVMHVGLALITKFLNMKYRNR